MYCLTRCASAASHVTSVDVSSASVVQYDSSISTKFAAVGPAPDQTPIRRTSCPLPQDVGGGGDRSRRGRLDVDRDGVVVTCPGSDEDGSGV